MSDFQNTIDVLGDDITARMIVDRTIEEYNDGVIASIARYAFGQCSKLASVNLPNVTRIGEYAFISCAALTIVNLPNATNIRSKAFIYCYALATVILRSPTVCTISSTDAFTNTPFDSGKAGGTLLVPRALVEEYKTATNWSVIWGYGHNRFLALEDYTVDGTITGEIDWDKLNGGTTA